MMNDVPVLDKEMSTTGKNLSDSIVEKYAFVFQSCDVDMKLLVENKVSHYPASDVLLKRARFLYRNQEIGWIEALAAFQEKHGDCLALDGKDAAKALEKAFDLCRWMGEESDYLQTVYQRRADEKRTELFDRMDRLSLKLKVCRCLSEGKTNEYLKAVLRKLEQSGNIWHVHDEILKIYYLLSYDLTGFSQNLPVLIDIVCRLITNGLMTEEECDDFSGVLKRKAKEMDDKVSEYWFSDDWDTLHPLITESVRLHTFVFLICGQCRQKEDDLSLIAARICRYLSRIPSPYSELLKNKSYTLLTGGEKRILTGGKRHRRKNGQQGVSGCHRRKRPGGRAALLDECAAIRQREREHEHLQNRVQQQAERGGGESFSQRHQAVAQRAVQQRMQRGIGVIDMLLILRGEIVVDHAGKKRKPDRKPAQQNDQRIAPQGKAQRLGFAGLCAEQPRG